MQNPRICAMQVRLGAFIVLGVAGLLAGYVSVRTVEAPRDSESTTERAKPSLSELKRHLSRPERAEYVSVQVVCPNGEAVWLEGVTVKNGQVEGLACATGPETQPQVVRVSDANLRDWMVIRNQEMTGGYTLSTTLR